LIVSDVELVDNIDDGFVADKVAGLKVAVGVAPGTKCERCWNYSPLVGSDSDYPDACPRCVAVLRAGVNG
jgi:isoleucyl-tRNA synthetase